MTDARPPMFHRTTLVTAAFDRLARAAGNSMDSTELGRDDLFFLADLPLSEDERHFADDRIGLADRVRLNALVDRCTRPRAEFLSAAVPSGDKPSALYVPTAARP